MTGYIEECQGSALWEATANTENTVEATESLGVYCEAIASLPEKCRHVYLLRKVHGMAHQEIADRLGISLSTVEKHLRMGVLSCRDYLDRANNDRSAVQIAAAAAHSASMQRAG